MSEFYVTISGSLLSDIDSFLFNVDGVDGMSLEDKAHCAQLRATIFAMCDGAACGGDSEPDLTMELLSEADKAGGRAGDLMRAASASIEVLLSRPSVVDSAVTDTKVMREALQRMVDVFGPGCADFLRGAEGDTLAHARHVLAEMAQAAHGPDNVTDRGEG